MLEALRHRALEPRQPGRGHRRDKENEAEKGPEDGLKRHHGQRLRVPRPGKARPGIQGRDLLHEGLRLLRERRHQELQQAREEMVSEGNRLQPADKAPDPPA